MLQTSFSKFLASALVLVLISAGVETFHTQEHSGDITDSTHNTFAQSTPILFVENIGQFEDEVRFQARVGDQTIWLTDDAIWITVFKAEEESAVPTIGSAPSIHRDKPTFYSRTGHGVHLKLSFIGANPHALLEPFDRQVSRFSYFMGSNKLDQYSGATAWGGVRYKDLYPGIDLQISSQNGLWNWQLVASPNAESNIVRLCVAGTKALTISKGGSLLLTTAVGQVSFPVPIINRTNLGQSNVIQTDVQTFEIQEPFRSSLVPSSIIPAATVEANLTYSTFLGGSSSDYGTGIAVGQDGATYITGVTFSSNFPTTPGAFDRSLYGLNDIFIAKLNATGSAILFATFLGGQYDETSTDIAVDSSGATYITGYTYSSDFPTTPTAFDTTMNSTMDAFVVKLSATGSTLLYSTLLGGNNDWDQGHDIVVDSGGKAYVTGVTWSSDFPTTPGTFDTTLSTDGDVFVTKLDTTGSSLDFSTFLGGSGQDIGYGIAIDGNGEVYIAGVTSSSNFPTTTGAYDTSLGGMTDAFVAKLNSSASAMVYATFLGGFLTDAGNSISVDNGGNAYITGRTSSFDFPTTAGAFDENAFDSIHSNAFVTKIDSIGSTLSYSTYLEGGNDDYGTDIAVDAKGSAYVIGDTRSSDFPTTLGAFDATFGGGDCDGQPCEDAFLVKLDSSGAVLIYGTFLGGTAIDTGYGIAVDIDGAVYATGAAASTNFPTTSGVVDTVFNGGEAFIVRAWLAIDAWAHLPPLVGVLPGGTTVVPVLVGNKGNIVATSIVLTATLTNELIYIGDTSIITPIVLSNTVVWNLPSLAPMQNEEFILWAAAPVAEFGSRYPITLTVTGADSYGPEANVLDNTMSGEVMIAHQFYLPLLSKDH
jgi:hypothetical protein